MLSILAALSLFLQEPPPKGPPDWKVEVVAKSGVVVAGRSLGDTAEELILLDAEGKRHTIRKAEIEQRKESELSLMPEGINTGLSLQDFADIVGYLESLKEAPKK